MKYENASKVSTLLKEIAKAEKDLEKLKNSTITVAVIDDKSNRLFKVDIGYQVPFSEQAKVFIESCISQLTDDITKLKKQLESL